MFVSNLIFVLFVYCYMYLLVKTFGYDAIDGKGEPKITVEEDDLDV